MYPAELCASINTIAQLSDEEMELLLQHISSRKLNKGDNILTEGEMCRSFYWVQSGHLRTWFNRDGTTINLNFTFENGFASNIKSFRNRQPSELTIEAGEDTLVWVVNIKSVAEQFNGNPQISRFVRRLALDLLMASEAHSDLFKIYTPTERYRYLEKHNPRLLQRIPLSQLASYLGVARETLSRIRGKSH